MENLLPIVIAVGLFFVIRFFKTKFKIMHLVLLLSITLYFIVKGITSDEQRYFNFLVSLLGAVSVFSLFREIKKQQPIS